MLELGALLADLVNPESRLTAKINHVLNHYRKKQMNECLATDLSELNSLFSSLPQHLYSEICRLAELLGHVKFEAH